MELTYTELNTLIEIDSLASGMPVIKTLGTEDVIQSLKEKGFIDEKNNLEHSQMASLAQHDALVVELKEAIEVRDYYLANDLLEKTISAYQGFLETEWVYTTTMAGKQLINVLEKTKLTIASSVS